ncbi:MAG: hypothetical protein NTZ01_03060 [Verrucomicrobia bacterium]|nr:hypothetical protein [Verrucomicrobiota bacterium]
MGQLFDKIAARIFLATQLPHREIRHIGIIPGQNFFHCLRLHVIVRGV